MTAALTHGDADPGSLTYPDGNIVITADHTGCIRVFRNDPVPRFGARSESDSVSVRSTASSIKKIILHPRQGLRFLRPGTNRAPSVTASNPASPLGWAQNASNVSLNDPGRSGSLTPPPRVPKAASLSSLESFSASFRRSSQFSVAGSSSGRQKSTLCPSCGSADVRGFSVLDERGLPGQMVVCVACNKVVSGI
ncbi:MAG: hypothetical protein BJ554DRAFT_8019 [Olpidium bornovanus]|uniref:Uncharacterized protein n=1 Tax=Olpidium bornovanus TaxID=278681 RepID=A0A8H8DJD7_9FUNG|nr:MAG: hypothetical protein BJ554DRAFT_8019 [Olpidium bornovanus]